MSLINIFFRFGTRSVNLNIWNLNDTREFFLESSLPLSIVTKESFPSLEVQVEVKRKWNNLERREEGEMLLKVEFRYEDSLVI